MHTARRIKTHSSVAICKKKKTRTNSSQTKSQLGKGRRAQTLPLQMKIYWRLIAAEREKIGFFKNGASGKSITLQWKATPPTMEAAQITFAGLKRKEDTIH